MWKHGSRTYMSKPPSKTCFCQMEPNVTRTSEPTCFFSETRRSRYQPLLLRAAAPIMWGMLRHTWNIFDMWSSILAPAILNMFCFAAKKGIRWQSHGLCAPFLPARAPPPLGLTFVYVHVIKRNMFTRDTCWLSHQSYTLEVPSLILGLNNLLKLFAEGMSQCAKFSSRRCLCPYPPLWTNMFDMWTHGTV